MQIDAIYDRGRLEFMSPVKLRSGRIRVRVEIPDQEVLPQSEVQSEEEKDVEYTVPLRVKDKAREIKARLDQIRNAPLPEDDQLPELTEKQMERIEAFALRDELKGCT
ncbi:MAG: hypothetical protein ACQERT_15850 [Thermodesulfobacteriota bacterium]